MTESYWNPVSRFISVRARIFLWCIMMKIVRVIGKDLKNILLNIIIVISEGFFSVDNLSANASK